MAGQGMYLNSVLGDIKKEFAVPKALHAEHLYKLNEAVFNLPEEDTVDKKMVAKLFQAIEKIHTSFQNEEFDNSDDNFFYDYLALLGTMQNQHFFSQKQTDMMLGWIREVVEDPAMGGSPGKKGKAKKGEEDVYTLQAEVVALKAKLSKYEKGGSKADKEEPRGKGKGKGKEEDTRDSKRSKKARSFSDDYEEEPPPRKGKGKGKDKEPEPTKSKGKGKGKRRYDDDDDDDYEDEVPKGKGKSKGKGSQAIKDEPAKGKGKKGKSKGKGRDDDYSDDEPPPVRSSGKGKGKAAAKSKPGGKSKGKGKGEKWKAKDS